MQVAKSIVEVRDAVAESRQRGSRVGCVPTMGALHAGHLSLMTECRRQCDYVVVWIFVNPTQFAPHEDLGKYPRPLEDDLAKCSAAGVDLVFTPEVSTLYPEGFETFVTVDQLSRVFEGTQRPTHFRGVSTIVTKIFNIIQPDVACFGQKDYQQQALIRRMVRDLDIPVEIVTCPTIREPDGLALSSRNMYLNKDERQAALSLYQSLQWASERVRAGETDLVRLRGEMLDQLRQQPLVQPDYATIADADTLEVLDVPRGRMVALVAARVGTTRLIDNLLLPEL
ncbi:MAG: pantoate--beta-alanine ligase [Planctomycetaceae bacterium]|nr:pantoate--beta-alanine ligase [Planctomycetaceae bacterium]